MHKYAGVPSTEPAVIYDEIPDNFLERTESNFSADSRVLNFAPDLEFKLGNNRCFTGLICFCDLLASMLKELYFPVSTVAVAGVPVLLNSSYVMLTSYPWRIDRRRAFDICLLSLKFLIRWALLYKALSIRRVFSRLTLINCAMGTSWVVEWISGKLSLLTADHKLVFFWLSSLFGIGLASRSPRAEAVPIGFSLIMLEVFSAEKDEFARSSRLCPYYGFISVMLYKCIGLPYPAFWGFVYLLLYEPGLFLDKYFSWDGS